MEDQSMPFDAGKFNEMIMELLIQNTAELRAMTGILATFVAGGDDKATANVIKMIHVEIEKNKKTILHDLFANFGYLPPDILGDEY